MRGVGMGSCHRVLVVGCGSLGGMFAHVLSRHAHVECFDPDKSLAARVNARGLLVVERRRRVRVPMTIMTEIRELKTRVYDAVVFTVKCPDLEDAVVRVLRACRARHIFFFHNGDPSLDFLKKDFPGVRVYRGVTTSAVCADRRGSVRIFSRGDVYLGAVGDDPAGLRLFLRIFSMPGYRVHVLRDHRRAVWAKLIFNAAMNPLPVMTGQGYDLLRTDDRIYQMVRRAVREGKRVARAYKVRLAFDPQRTVEALRRGRHGAGPYMGSMYGDLIQGRVSELEAIVGVLLREGQSAGIDMPTLRSIYAFIKNMEDRRG